VDDTTSVLEKDDEFDDSEKVDEKIVVGDECPLCG
jgi:hypothetical protein